MEQKSDLIEVDVRSAKELFNKNYIETNNYYGREGRKEEQKD